MKRILAITFLVLILTSCSSRRVCGGPGGKRCVTIEKPATLAIKNS